MALERPRFQFAAMCYDAVVMAVWGLVATEAVSLQAPFNSERIPLGAWMDSLAAVVIGFVMILAAFSSSSARVRMSNTGGVLGVVFSVLGASVVIDWVISLNSFYLGSGLAYTYAVIGPVAILFAGFPLGLSGSLMAFRSWEQGEPAPAIGGAQVQSGA